MKRFVMTVLQSFESSNQINNNRVNIENNEINTLKKEGDTNRKDLSTIKMEHHVIGGSKISTIDRNDRDCFGGSILSNSNAIEFKERDDEREHRYVQRKAKFERISQKMENSSSYPVNTTKKTEDICKENTTQIKWQTTRPSRNHFNEKIERRDLLGASRYQRTSSSENILLLLQQQKRKKKEGGNKTFKCIKEGVADQISIGYLKKIVSNLFQQIKFGMERMNSELEKCLSRQNLSFLILVAHAVKLIKKVVPI